MKRRQLIWTVLLLFGLLLTELVLAEPRTALVIGNSAYSDSPLSPLKNPINDARDMASALQSIGFMVTLGTNLQKRDMEEMISKFSRRLQQQHGVGLFFYAGYGVELNGHTYLIPIGLTIRSGVDVVYKAVDLGSVLNLIEKSGNSLNIIILDIRKDYTSRRNPFEYNSEHSLASGLASMNAPIDSIIAYSTTPGGLAMDGLGRNSPYTSALLAVMGTPGLSIEQVFKRVLLRVVQATDNKQIPWVSSSLTTDFYFVAAQPVFRDTLRNGSQGPEMVKIRGGRFLMGSPPNEKGRNEDERQHEVRVADFAMGKYEVTVGQFRRFVDVTGYRTDAEKSGGCYTWILSEWKLNAGKTWRNPGFSQTDEHPVVCVSWNDAMAYVDWLGEQTGQNYRLPTEAEWEYAARAGTQTAYYWGDNPDQGCTYSNGADQTAKEQFPDWTVMNCRDDYVYTAPVGRFRPNAVGLYDMLGNIWEWTCSEYDKGYGGAELRCIGDKNASGYRVVRGGSWCDGPDWSRGAARLRIFPQFGFDYRGFRLVKP